jgi:ABC-type branched-subunit amino acid transport system substrate-binding protein
MYLLNRYLPDAIYLPAKSSELTQLASQARFYGLGQSRLLGTEQWYSERVIRLGDKYVEGTVFYSPFYENGEDLRWNEFKDLYEKTYLRPVNRYSAQGYDAVGLIMAAADSLPTDRKLLAENLNHLDSYPGAMAVYTIGSDGRVKRKIFILELLHGNVVKAGAEQNVPENPDKDLQIAPLDSIHPGSSQP